MRFQVALSYKLRLRSDSTGRIFDHLKNLTGHLVHTEPFKIFALFTRDCRTVILPSKASRVTTRLVNPCWSCSQYLFAMFLSFSSCVTTHPCSHSFAVLCRSLPPPPRLSVPTERETTLGTRLIFDLYSPMN